MNSVSCVFTPLFMCSLLFSRVKHTPTRHISHGLVVVSVSHHLHSHCLDVVSDLCHVCEAVEVELALQAGELGVAEVLGENRRAEQSRVVDAK